MCLSVLHVVLGTPWFHGVIGFGLAKTTMTPTVNNRIRILSKEYMSLVMGMGNLQVSSCLPLPLPHANLHPSQG